ncbi:RNA polymerase sigma-70 factor (ECF subfamily) [Frondihabitans sp. PhB188]|uniref:RNA polymerase sigma factor n=1 Tax=Frondihabitans sp. PhB188 TaxID=2485200 RepID=UPI000FA7A8D9|nr:RNA polymerase sigma factor [Frondihabitans sp. PhB188]ROQ39692.1 RNA polymerase sigma-70 factor (ECF subfamily) [Frondihabitans sp. PhB188]
MKRPRDDTDEHELVRLAQRGDEQAFATLFDRHSRTVYRYAWGLADVRSDADDLVQETFLVAWRRRATIRIVDSSVVPWLLTTCRNVSLNLNRQRRRLRTDELAEASVGDPTWHRRIDQEAAAEELTWVRDEIAALSEVDRRLCQLCLIEGRSYEDASMLLGLTAASARKRIQRTRSRLRALRAD